MKTMKKPIIYLLLISFIISSAICSPAAYAQEQQTIEYQWQRTYSRGGGVYGDLREDAVPIVDKDSNVYIADTDGFINCIGPDGEIRYRANIYQSGSSNKTGASAPVADKNSNIYIPSGDGNIYSFSSDGNLRWTYKMDTGVSVRGTSVLSPDEKTVYSADEGGRVYAVNASDGKLIWRTYANMGYGFTNPVLSDGGSTLYVAGGAKIAAFDTSAGVGDADRMKWLETVVGDGSDYFNFYLMSSGSVDFEKPLTVDDRGNVYAVSDKSRQDEYYLHKFSPEGEELWRMQMTEARTEVTPPLYHEGMLYYKTSQNKLFRLNPHAGNPVPELVLEVRDLDTGGYNEKYRQAPIPDSEGNLYLRFGKQIYVVSTQGEILRKSSEVNAQQISALYITEPDSKGQIYVNTRFFLYKYRDSYIKQVPHSLGLESFALEKGTVYEPEPVIRDEMGAEIADDFHIVFESENEDVLKVDGDKIIAVKSGTVNLRASLGEISREVQVTVLDDLTSAEIKIKSLSNRTTIGIEEKTQLTGEILYNNIPVKGKTIIWESKHPHLASVDENGYVTGVGEGKARINAYVKNDESAESYIAITVAQNVIGKVKTEDLKDALIKSITYYRGRGILDDWDAYVVNGAGVDPVSIDRNYVEKIKSKMKAGNGSAGTQMTDYERTVIGLVSAGQDATHFIYDDALYASSGGTKGYVDFVREIREGAAGGLGQGINAAIWGLAALNAVEYDKTEYAGTKYDEDYFIDYILKNKSGQGWAYGSGGSADPDMTGMALYALAPYRNDTRLFGGTTVKAEGTKAIEYLSQSQNDDGKFGSWGTINSCSVAQVIMGITSWGYDPQGDMFTKRNGNALTALMSYYIGDGTFKYTSSFDPAFGTPQSLEGVISAISYYESSDDLQMRRSTAWENIRFCGDVKQDISSISILPGNISLKKGQEISLTVITNTGNTIKTEDLEWTTSGSVSVNGGNLSADDVPGGTVTVKYNYEDRNYTAGINVNVVSGNEYELIKTDSVQLPDFENTPYEIIVRNNTESRRTVLLMVNLYKKSNDSLVGQVAAEVSINAGKSQRAAAAFSVPQGEYYIKVMLWEGFTTIKSLKDAITIQGVK